MGDKERYETALEKISEHMKGPWSHQVISELAENALHPPPEMEDVPVTRHVCLDGKCGSIYRPEDMHMVENNLCGACGNPLVEMTGTLKRPKPQKVEKSVSVEAFLRKNGEPIPTADTSEYAFNEALGTFPADKKGTLTFTWTE